MKTYGRKTIYSGYTEKQLLSMDNETLIKTISAILKNAIITHKANKDETVYLKKYLNGEQDIFEDKIKLTRKEIDNKIVENWAFAFVDFKKTYLLGKPIQYVQLDDSCEEEISLLNKYARYENKKAKDMLLFEDVLVAGRGFRYTKNDIMNNEDEAPFELLNVDSESCEVIYSSKLGNEQLFSFIETPMQTIITNIDTKENEIYDYMEYTVYLRNKSITFTGDSSSLKQIGEIIPITLNEHIITEYYLNRSRISLIELGKDLFNNINYLESLDMDDMEQFVNAIMVFTNATVNEDDLSEIKRLGAVSIKSTDQQKASITLLQNRLNAVDTQTFYTRLVTSLHQILGVPMSGDNGTVTSGDTGKAKLTGQGFTSAGIRAEGDETMFGMCDINSLKVIIKICKENPQSKISNLRVSNIDLKFQRDMSDNLLVKTQALLSLYACDIPRKFANSIIGLFGDSNAVTKEQERLFGEQVSQQGKDSKTLDTKEQNNDIVKIEENNNQNK